MLALKGRLAILWFRTKNYLFSWHAEKEEDGGSIVFTFAQRIHFLKYKDMTIIYFGKGRFTKARRNVQAFPYY